MKNILLASRLGLFSALILTLSSCGGGSGTCGNTAACGGDIVGTWTISSTCVSVTAMTAMMPGGSCPGITVGSSSLDIKGSITYNADLTYSSSTTTTGSLVENIPASCLVSQGITLTCTQLNQVFAAMGATSPFQSFNCVGSSGCSCTVVLKNQASTATGTYSTTAAGALTLMNSASATPSVDDYCVNGSTLTESPRAGSTMMGTMVSGTITLAKQ
jgi:hypothetical protein